MKFMSYVSLSKKMSFENTNLIYVYIYIYIEISIVE